MPAWTCSGSTELAWSAVPAVCHAERAAHAQAAGLQAPIFYKHEPVAARVRELTPQQFRVLSMLGAGLLNKQIAYELGVSEATVKAHMTAILRKLGASNRTQAVLVAGRLALDPDGVRPPPPDDD